jgi:hypothetical protein
LIASQNVVVLPSLVDDSVNDVAYAFTDTFYITPGLFDDSANDATYVTTQPKVSYGRITKLGVEGAPRYYAHTYLAPTTPADDVIYNTTVVTSTNTLTPSLFVDGDVFYGPTISIAPSLFDDSVNDTFYAPVVSSIYLAPSLVDDSANDAFYAPLVELKGIQPPLFVDSDTFYTPAVVNTNSVTAPYVDDSANDVIYPPVEVAIDEVTPPYLVSDDSIFAPVVSAVAYVNPSLVDDSANDAIYAASMAQGINPALVASDDTFYRPSLLATAYITSAEVDDDFVFISPFVAMQLNPPLVTAADVIPSVATLAFNGIQPQGVVVAEDIFPPIVVQWAYILETLYIDAFEQAYSPIIGSSVVPDIFLDSESIFSPVLTFSNIPLHPPLVTEADLFYTQAIGRVKKQGNGGGSNPGTVNGNQKYATRMAMGGSGTIFELQANASKAQTGIHVQMAVYSDNAGKPDQLLGVTNVLVTTVSGLNSFFMVTGVGVTQGQYIWVALLTDATFKWLLSPSTAGSAFNADTFTSGFSNPFGDYTVDNQNAPVVVVYMASANQSIITQTDIIDTDTIPAPSIGLRNNVLPPAIIEVDSIWLPVTALSEYDLYEYVIYDETTDPDPTLRETIYSPTAKLIYSINPALFIDSEAIFTPSVDYRLLVGFFDSDDVVYIPAVVNFNYVTAPLVIDSDTFLGGLISQVVFPNQNIGGAQIDSDDVIYAPFVQNVRQLVVPGLFDDSANDIFWAPTVTSIDFVAPPPFASDDVIYSDVIAPGPVTLIASLFDDSAIENIYPPIVSGENDLFPELAQSFEIEDGILSPVVSTRTYIYPPLFVDDAERVWDTTVTSYPKVIDLTQHLYPPTVDEPFIFYPGFVGRTTLVIERTGLLGIVDMKTTLKSEFDVPISVTLAGVMDFATKVAGTYEEPAQTSLMGIMDPALTIQGTSGE